MDLDYDEMEATGMVGMPFLVSGQDMDEMDPGGAVKHAGIGDPDLGDDSNWGLIDDRRDELCDVPDNHGEGETLGEYAQESDLQAMEEHDSAVAMTEMEDPLHAPHSEQQQIYELVIFPFESKCLVVKYRQRSILYFSDQKS
jgi:hypothetical protein